jgi:hypothetical protein
MLSFRDNDGKLKESIDLLNVSGVQELRALENAREKLVTQKNSDVDSSLVQNQVLQ